MDFRFSQFEILTGVGTFVLCVFFVCVFSEVSAIENELAADVAGAMQGQELYWSGVEINGQEVVLTGAAPDVPARLQAVNAVAAITGVTAVDNQIQVIGADGTCQTELDDYLERETINFKAGKADISEASFRALGMLAMIVRSCDSPLEIAGHTDDEGDAEINQRLSQRRADEIAKHLVRHGADPGRIKAVGYGETQPLADNGTEAGRMKNRRIEFRVMGS